MLNLKVESLSTYRSCEEARESQINADLPRIQSGTCEAYY